MEKELLEMLTSAKNEEELANLLQNFLRSTAGGAQMLSPENLDGISGGAGNASAGLREIILGIYDYLGSDTAFDIIRSQYSVPQTSIDQGKEMK